MRCWSEAATGRTVGARRRATPGVAVSMLTSGTTGPPKRVPIGYRNLAASFAGAAHYESGTPWRARLRSGLVTGSYADGARTRPARKAAWMKLS